jgi:hypothetical protein
MKSMNFGTNILQDKPYGLANIYWQMLRGARMATTPYVAIAEDDVLYSKQHFNSYRPPSDHFAYNLSRWSLYVWWRPVYNYRAWRSNFALIAPRELMIEALEERFAKQPSHHSDGFSESVGGELGKVRIEKLLGVTRRNVVDFASTVPNVVFQHDYGLDDLAKRHRKAMGTLKAYNIPYWGEASELSKRFI